MNEGEMEDTVMKLPKQAEPVSRRVGTARIDLEVKSSGSCGCEHKCDGLCLFGTCIGYCH